MTDLAQAMAWHRQVAALVEAADRVGVGASVLPGVRERLRHQQARFTELAARNGSPLPLLIATASEIAAAAPALGDLSDAAVAGAFRTITTTLDAADAALTQATNPGSPQAPPGTARPTQFPAAAPATPSASAHHSTAPASQSPAPGSQPAASAGHPVDRVQPHALDRPQSTLERWPVALRNGLVYAGFATAVLVVQLASLVLLDEERALPMLAPVCLLVLPAFAWAAGWLTIGLVFRQPRDAGSPGRPAPTGAGRSPRLGAVICLLPNLLLCAGVVVLFLAR